MHRPQPMEYSTPGGGCFTFNGHAQPLRRALPRGPAGHLGRVLVRSNCTTRLGLVWHTEQKWVVPCTPHGDGGWEGNAASKGEHQGMASWECGAKAAWAEEGTGDGVEVGGRNVRLPATPTIPSQRDRGGKTHPAEEHRHVAAEPALELDEVRTVRGAYRGPTAPTPCCQGALSTHEVFLVEALLQLQDSTLQARGSRAGCHPRTQGTRGHTCTWMRV